MKNIVRAKKIPDNNHTLDETGQITLNRLRTGNKRLNSHMHRRMNLVPSPLCTCGTDDQTKEHMLQMCPSYHISENRYGQTEIITPEVLW